MDTINHEVGRRIAATIEDKKRSKLSVAEGTGIPNVSLHRKLKGDAPTTIAELARIADELQVHPGTLLPSRFHSKGPAQ